MKIYKKILLLSISILAIGNFNATTTATNDNSNLLESTLDEFYSQKSTEETTLENSMAEYYNKDSITPQEQKLATEEIEIEPSSGSQYLIDNTSEQPALEELNTSPDPTIQYSPDHKLSERKLQNIQSRINKATQHLKEKDIARTVARQLQEHRQNQEYQEQIQLREQNQLLLSIGPYLGIFKRDIIEGGVLAGYLYSDHLLCKKIEQLRLDYLANYIYKNIDEFTRLIQDIKTEQEHLQKLSVFNKIYNTLKFKNPSKKYNELINTLKHKLTYIHSSLNKKLIIPSILKLLAEYGMDKIEDRLITQSPYPKILQTSYIKDANNELSPISPDDEPISIVSILKFFLAPRLFYKNLNKTKLPFNLHKSNTPILKHINDMFEIGIPNVLFKPTIYYPLKEAFNVLTLCGGIKLYDNQLRDSLTKHITSNPQSCINKLHEIRNINNKTSCIKSIKDYISTNQHKAQSLRTLWRNKEDINSAFITLPIIGVITYKIYQGIKATMDTVEADSE